MSFDWSEYLTLAQALGGDDVATSEEARLRSAISRAYYAVYGTAQVIARSRDGYTPQATETSHQGLINHFKRSPDRVRKAIGMNLERLRKSRVTADYERHVQGKLFFEVKATLSLAASVLQDLERLRTS